MNIGLSVGIPFSKPSIDIFNPKSVGTVAANFSHIVSAYAGNAADQLLGCIGAGYIVDGARFLKGSIAEVILYSDKLSNANRIKVERYLLRKWGISYRA
ncbi:hypothetical protein [Bacillus sp. OTU530]|uniref:hypothetical protein n=1 Tax=Bacillus sp. OTU530 TaxID=3043862 RepID=UPI00313D4AA4